MLGHTHTHTHTLCLVHIPDQVRAKTDCWGGPPDFSRATSAYCEEVTGSREEDKFTFQEAGTSKKICIYYPSCSICSRALPLENGRVFESLENPLKIKFDAVLEFDDALPFPSLACLLLWQPSCVVNALARGVDSNMHHSFLKRILQPPYLEESSFLYYQHL